MLPVTHNTKRLPRSASSRGGRTAGDGGGSGGSKCTGTPAAGFGSFSEPELMRRVKVSTGTVRQSSRTRSARGTATRRQPGGVRAVGVVETPRFVGPTASVVDANTARASDPNLG